MRKKRKFEKMYKAYTDEIFRFFLANTRETELSEDLTADTFAKAWDKIDSFDGKYERAWLYRIAKNRLVDHWRKKKPVPLDEDIEIVDERDSHEAVLDAQFESDRIHSAMGGLPHVMRSVVTLRFIEGYSAKQTADALNISESNVRVLQHRALKKLQGLLS